MVTHLLGQIGGTVDVPDLPGGPLLDRLIFEQPLATALGLALIGIIGGAIAARNGRGRVGGIAAVVACALGAAVVTAGNMVETTRERLARAAGEFVDAACAGRTGEVGGLLENRITLRSAGETLDEGRDWVLSVVGQLPGVVTEHSVRMRGATVEGPNRGRTRMTVRVRAEGAYGGDMYSSWDLVWIRRPEGGADGWWIGAIECLSIFGREPDSDWVRQGAEIARSRSGQ